MIAGLLRLVFSACLMAVIFVAWTVSARAAPLPRASYASVGPATSVPYGWLDFCQRERSECSGSVLPALDVNLTQATFSKLDHINRMVNGAIEPVTNLDHWGTMLDHWDYPLDGKGDCKVFALYKRKLLMDMGFPRQALLMTIVRDLNDEGHAILTVKTNRGEFVLDNLSDEIRPWDSTGYRFIKRQSQEDPNVWVALDPDAATQVQTAAQKPTP
ncbi:MAG TPA: transglutaminase-like cysteine peptidase [Roseiarcus sp.]|nr:transglutaminase-like cysteine peptidase [Roseiarcus sp.]